MPKYLTGAEAGLSGDEQIRIALRAILNNGGVAEMPLLYKAVEQKLNGAQLSKQGKASLRYFINRVAVRAGYLFPSIPDAPPGWRITPEGKEFVAVEIIPNEEVVNTSTEQVSTVPSYSAQGTNLSFTSWNC